MGAFFTAAAASWPYSLMLSLDDQMILSMRVGVLLDKGRREGSQGLDA